MANNKTTESKDNVGNKYPTYSDELYVSDPDMGDVSNKKIKGSSFRGSYFIKILFYALMMFSFAFWQIDQEQAKEQVLYYEIETVVSMPSRDSIRELLVPRVQESIAIRTVFAEFQNQLLLLIGDETANKSGSIANEAVSEGSDVSFAKGILVQEDYQFPSENGIDSKTGIKLSMQAHNPNSAKYWIQSLINKAELNARVALVESTTQQVNDRIYEITSQFSDQLKIDRRQSDQLMADLLADFELAERLGVVLPIDSPHPLAPENANDDYLEGTEALKKQIDALAKKLDKGAFSEDTQTLSDKKLIVELETLKAIDLDPKLILTAETGYPYVVRKILQENKATNAYILGLLWGFLAAWVVLRILSFIRNAYISLTDR